MHGPQALASTVAPASVNTFIKLLDRRNLPDILVQVIAWVLGEYSNLCTLGGFEDPADIVDALGDYCRNL